MVKKRRLNREIVVAVAARLANEAGSFSSLTLAGLAAALDVRTPSLYNHIANLEDLQAALALHGLRQLLAAIRKVTLGKTGREAVLAIAHSYRAVALANPGIYELMLRAPTPDQTSLHEVSEQLVQHILLVLTAYGLEGEAALHAVRGVRSLAHGFVSLELAGGFGLDLSREESYTRLVETFLHGLA